MSYLKFDKNLVINLEKSLTKNMLRTNKLGAYSVTTITDCNTSKYDGLLVVPLPEKNNENYVLLSSLDETIIQHGAEFNMGIHKFQGDNFSPKGHKYIREFTMETVACTTYRVGGVVFSKERVFITNEKRILIKYTLLETKSVVTFRFKPLLAFRNVSDLTHENNMVKTECSTVENGVSSQMYDGFPLLYMQFSRKNEFVSSPDWYRGVEYFCEQERGYDYKEDLFTPGYFELSMKKGESVIFSAGITESKPSFYKRMYDEEIAKRTSRKDFFYCLKNAGQQFYNIIDGGDYLMAGYPWFKCRARDEFISLPGIMLSTNNMDLFYSIMDTSVKALNDFMEDKPNVSQITEIEMPDVFLWAIWTIQQYAKKTSIEQAREKYGNLVFKMVDFIRNQKHPNLFLHENGLLYTNGESTPVTWMNATVWGNPVTPRTGYVVEINALWYNALKFTSELLALSEGDEYKKDVLDYQSEMLKESFVQTFWNGIYLYDYVSGGDKNKEVRPNMIFAVSLPYSPLDKTQQKKIVDIVTRELLTPRGIRSLSPKSGMYRSQYVGNEIERSYSYHNGTVWPWLIGPFADAYLKIYKRSGLFFMERNIIGFEAEMGEACIGTLNELYDGNPPYKERGAMSFAMSVAETLRTLATIKELDAVEE